jgi:hypothetical protein
VDIARVYLNKSLQTVLGKWAPNIRPDVTAVGANGEVHQVEIRSEGQTLGQLRAKLADSRQGLNGIGGEEIVINAYTPAPTLSPFEAPLTPAEMLLGEF